MPRTALLFSICCLSCVGQKLGTRWFDTSNMKVSVAMDRQTYLPGEAAQITLTVTNPSSKRVKSLKPFLATTSCVRYTIDAAIALRASQAQDGEVCPSVSVNKSNTTMFAPGETKQFVLNSYDYVFGTGMRALGGSSVPTRPGTQSLSFEFGRSAAQIEYQVSPAKLEAHVMARLQDILFTSDPTRMPPAPLARYVHVLALRSDGMSYVCVQQANVSNTSHVVLKVDPRDNIDFDDSHAQVQATVPFKRVATSGAPIVSLTATADAQENLTIDWTDVNGGQGHLFYPASYPARHNQ